MSDDTLQIHRFEDKIAVNFGLGHETVYLDTNTLWKLKEALEMGLVDIHLHKFSDSKFTNVEIEYSSKKG